MSKASSQYIESLSPKLFELQCKLIEKRYGVIAVIFIRLISVSSISREKLVYVEPVLIALSHWLKISRAIQEVISRIRAVVSSRYLGSRLHEFAFFILGSLILFVLVAANEAVFNEHWSKLIPLMYWAGFWYVLSQVLKDTFLREFYLYLGLMIPALTIFAKAPPAS